MKHLISMLFFLITIITLQIAVIQTSAATQDNNRESSTSGGFTNNISTDHNNSSSEPTIQNHGLGQCDTDHTKYSTNPTIQNHGLGQRDTDHTKYSTIQNCVPGQSYSAPQEYTQAQTTAVAPVSTPYWLAPSGFCYPWFAGINGYRMAPIIYQNGLAAVQFSSSTVFLDLYQYMTEAFQQGRLSQSDYYQFGEKFNVLSAKDAALYQSHGGLIPSGDEQSLCTDLIYLGEDVASKTKPSNFIPAY